MEEFKLFANCKLVVGARRATVCDLQRGDVHFVPKSFATALLSGPIYKDAPVTEEMTKCLDYMLENDLGHFTGDSSCFPEMSLEYDFPGEASHAIVEYADDLTLDIRKVLSSLSETGVKYIELRINRAMNVESMFSLMQSVQQTSINNIILYVHYSEDWNEATITELLLRYQRISSIVFTKAASDRFTDVMGRKVSFVQGSVSNKECGKVHTRCFSCNVRTFTEGLSHNSCLNGKISIDKEGSIKNCPSMGESFGNVNTHRLTDVVKQESFRKLWTITKDKIAGCKDCEFRYVCTDCRAFLESPDDIYSKPLKCGYDPYTGIWEEWSQNPFKEKAIRHYALATL